MDKSKIKQIQKTLNKDEIFFVFNKSNLFYLTGENLEGYILVISKKCVKILTSSMFLGQIRKFFKNSEIVVGYNIDDQISKLNLKDEILLIDDNSLPFRVYHLINKKYKVKFSPFIYNLRKIKTKEEINKIKMASIICNNVLNKTLNFIKPGVKEVEVKNFILKKFLEYNVEPSFDPIVAFDSNTSYPHHIPTHKKFKKDSLILIDLGCRYKGYCCDITRVYNYDKNPEIKFLYFKLKTLQKILISMCKSGVKVKEIDGFAIEYFDKLGFKKNYLHSTGHGLGIDIHELPQISIRDDTILQEGMVFTLEPAIYFEGRFGLRIEDDVLCMKNSSYKINK